MATSACSPKPRLAQRPPLSAPQAAALSLLYDSLANETRLRLLHLLAVSAEAAPGELAERVGQSAQVVNNHLHKLADRGIVASRREGSFVYYRIIDPCVITIMERGLCLLEDSRRRA